MIEFYPEKNPVDWKIIPSKYAIPANRKMYMRKLAYDAFEKMATAAKSDGITLKIISAFRSYYHQASIWNRKWNGNTKVDGNDLSKTESNPIARAMVILKYSSMPGTSRHHWGTDIDMNSLENSYIETCQGLQ